MDVLSFAAGLATGLKNSGGGEGIIDQDYEFFKSLPEPTDNQTVWRIRADDSKTFKISAHCKAPADTPANLTIDWGDGLIENYSLVDATTASDYTKDFSHDYGTTGDYTVICTIDSIERCPFWTHWVGVGIYCKIIMAKYGEKIRIDKYKSQGFGAFSNAFDYLQYLKIPSDTNISDNYFFQNLYSLRRINFDGKFTEIPNYTFYNCYCLNFNNLNFLEVVTVGNNAFYNCFGLTNVDWSVCETIADSAFQFCRSLQNVSIPKCRTIGKQSFSYCNSLSKIKLPLCTSIGDYAFDTNHNLKTITAPVCASVGSAAFLNCYNLRTAEFADKCTFGLRAFYNCYSLYPIPA